MNLIMNLIALIIGWSVIVIFIIFLLSTICESISDKVKDFKSNKRTIKKGTIMFIDGERVEIKTDLNIRFKKRKTTICECDNFKYLSNTISGYCFNNKKDTAQNDFENKLLKAYKNGNQEVSKVVGKVMCK